VTSKVLAAAKKLLTIGCFCIGTDQTDLDRAAELGVAVFNVRRLCLPPPPPLLRFGRCKSAAPHTTK
jgi:hypothetical protein